MKYVFEICIFVVILVLYLHIYFHLKVSNDLEVYSIEEPSKDKLEEICDLRQPVYFNFNNQNLMKKCTLENLEENYGAFDIQLRDVSNIDDDNELGLPFVLTEALEILQNDKQSRFISELNKDFLEETGMVKQYQYNDSFLRPPLVSSCLYDFMTGSKDAKTILRYNLNYRNYYYVTKGEVIVRLIPPKNTKYLYAIKDYDNFEFRSPVNPWNIQDKYKKDYDKIKSLDIVLKEGMILYIPAYWWYSIKFVNLSSISILKYRTYMNTVAILPEICMNLLQNQNIKRNALTKIIENQEIKEE
tara:strand:- start:14309 stop:15211 length:903 start_codon:yes stop_codon:yes gene_type:complete